MTIGCQFTSGDDFDNNLLHIYDKDLCRSGPGRVKFVFNFNEITV